MSLEPFKLRGAPVPDTYAEFIQDAKGFVESKGLHWNIDLNSEGRPNQGCDWDLRVLTGSHARVAARTNGFSVEVGSRDKALAAGWNPALLPQGEVLDKHVQDFIKAVLVARCKEKHEPRDTRHYARIYRRLFSTTTKMPWELSTDDLERFVNLLEGDAKVIDAVISLAHLINEYMLSKNCPLSPRGKTTLEVRFANYLTERTNSERLPDVEALYELVRIVFQMEPKSHQDRIRFCAIRLLILTGLRLNEVLMLPRDCLRWQSHVDVVTGRPADQVGGIGQSLQLRYFAEKHVEGAPDLLVEECQWVPQKFQRAVVEAVELARSGTEQLRCMLARQDKTASAYPRSDLRRFKTSAGRELGTADLLFLVMTGHDGHLPPRLREDEAIAPVSVPSFYQALSSSLADRRSTLFTRYGQSETAHSMSIKPHALRHLLNTELFRQAVPDTIITLQFGRQSVVQSHEYDHRSLAERLEFVRLPTSAAKVIKTGTPQEFVAKMVVSGMVPESHIGKTFKAIQAEQGDEAAFRYLAANSDGFHVTPYGYCTNSFSLNPCARHLKCFDRCRHFTASGLSEHRTTLESLRVKLVAMRAAAASKPVTTLGRKNQIAHADTLITGVDAALAAQANTRVFPEGPDHSVHKDLFR